MKYFFPFLLFLSLNNLKAQDNYFVESNLLPYDVYFWNIASDDSIGHYLVGMQRPAAPFIPYVMHCANSGAILWEKTFPSAGYWKIAGGVDADQKSLYISGRGERSSPTFWTYGYVMRMKPDGTPLWEVSVDSTNMSDLTLVKCTADGGCVAVGSSRNMATGTFRPVFMRADSSGNVLWYTREQPDSSTSSMYTDVEEAPDGSFYCSGWIYDALSGNYGVLAKYSSTGQLLWSKKYTHSSHIWYHDLVITGNRIFLAGETTTSPGHRQRGLLAKTDMNGNPIMARLYMIPGDTNPGYDQHSVCRRIELTKYNTLAVLMVGSRTSNPMTDFHCMIDEIDTVSLAYIRGTRSRTNLIYVGLATDTAGNNHLAGYTGNLDGYAFGRMSYDWYPGCGFVPDTVSLLPVNMIVSGLNQTRDTLPTRNWSWNDSTSVVPNSKCSNDVGLPEQPSQSQIYIYPNPTSDKCVVTFEKTPTHEMKLYLRNIGGEIVSEIVIQPGQQVAELNVVELCSGIYLLTGENGIAEKLEVVND